MKLFLLSFVFCLFGCYANSEKVVEEKLDFKIEEIYLENGLKVIIIPMHCKGCVFVSLHYEVGSCDDPRDIVGVSHFLEHAMFLGTKTLAGAELKKILNKYTQYTNACTSFNTTCYQHICNKNFLDIILKIEADRMQNLLLDDNAIEKEKQIILEERGLKLENSPLTKYIMESVFKIMFLYSKYSYPLIGYSDQIKNCNKEALQKHYKKYYIPNNATLFIVGDVEKEDIVPKVKQYFGNIKKGKIIQREEPKDPKKTGIKYVIEHSNKQISVNQLELYYKIKSKALQNIEDYFVLYFVAEILSDVMQEIMVDKNQTAYETEVEPALYWKNSHGYLAFSASFSNEQLLTNIVIEIEDIIENNREKYFTEEKLAMIKQACYYRIAKMQDDPLFMASMVGNLLSHGFSLLKIQNLTDIIKNIKVEDLIKYAKKNLQNKNCEIKICTHPKKNIK